MKDILAIILGGGDSTRFWPITDKNFINYFSIPLVQHSILQLKRFGLKEFLVVVNHKNKYLFESVQRSIKDIKINIVVQKDPRGMAGAILACEKYIKNRKVLIIGPSDIFEDIIFADFKKALSKNPYSILTGTVYQGYFPGGYIKVKKDRILDIVEKPKKDELPSNIVRFVFDYYKDTQPLLKSIKSIKSNQDDIYEKAIQDLIKKDYNFEALSYKGYWGYLKYPWHALNVMEYFLKKISKTEMKKNDISKSTNIAGNVIICENVKIMENVKIVGPVYIGKNTIIGQNCLIRESMIGSNCVIGFGTEIARSYISDTCWFHTNYIGDSFIGENVGIGAGSVLANLRLDEGSIYSEIQNEKINTYKVKLGSIIGSNVRIGVNASIMPGVKIGHDSFIGAGCVLNKDLSDNSYCISKTVNYQIKKNVKKVTGELRKDVKNKLKF